MRQGQVEEVKETWEMGGEGDGGGGAPGSGEAQGEPPGPSAAQIIEAVDISARRAADAALAWGRRAGSGGRGAKRKDTKGRTHAACPSRREREQGGDVSQAGKGGKAGQAVLGIGGSDGAEIPVPMIDEDGDRRVDEARWHDCQ